MSELIATKPTPGPARPFRFPPFERARLDNGLTVITCDIAGRPLISAALVTEAGAFNEPAGAEGIATLTARAMSEGTARFPGISFAEAAESIGADVSAHASWETIIVGCGTAVSRFPDALELVAEAALHPEFPPAEIERLKTERVNQIMQADAQPMQRAMRAFYETTYTSDSPFHRRMGGSAGSVSGMDRAAVERFYSTFVTPRSATLVVVGDLTGIPVLKLADQLFGLWNTPEPARTQPRNAAAVSAPTVTIVDRPGAVQTNFLIGHDGVARGDADELALDVMNTAFGGSFSSRLNQRLREEKGYTYGARSMIAAQRIPGPMLSFAPVETSVTEPAIADTLGEYERLVAEGITDEELTFARDYMGGIFALRFETPETIANGIIEMVEYGLDDDYFDRYAPALASLTTEDVNAATRAHVQPDRFVIALCGDAEKIADPLRIYGTLSVVEDPR